MIHFPVNEIALGLLYDSIPFFNNTFGQGSYFINGDTTIFGKNLKFQTLNARNLPNAPRQLQLSGSMQTRWNVPSRRSGLGITRSVKMKFRNLLSFRGKDSWTEIKIEPTSRGPELVFAISNGRCSLQVADPHR